MRDRPLAARRERPQGISSVRTTYNRSQVPIEHIVNGVPNALAWRLLRPFLRDEEALANLPNDDQLQPQSDLQVEQLGRPVEAERYVSIPNGALFSVVEKRIDGSLFAITDCTERHRFK